MAFRFFSGAQQLTITLFTIGKKHFEAQYTEMNYLKSLSSSAKRAKLSVGINISRHGEHLL